VRPSKGARARLHWLRFHPLDVGDAFDLPVRKYRSNRVDAEKMKAAPFRAGDEPFYVECAINEMNNDGALGRLGRRRPDFSPEQNISSFVGWAHAVAPDDSDASVLETWRRARILETVILLDDVNFVAGANDISDGDFDMRGVVASKRRRVHWTLK